MRAARIRLLAVVRARILRALVWYSQTDPTDPLAMQEPQEQTDTVMDSLFGRWPPTT